MMQVCYEWVGKVEWIIITVSLWKGEESEEVRGKGEERGGGRGEEGGA